MNTITTLDCLYKEERELVRNYYLSFPLMHNPNLDKDGEIREQLIRCPCSGQYRVMVNGNTPVADFIMEGIKCPLCKRDAKEYVSISGHSGGYFNSSVRKL